MPPFLQFVIRRFLAIPVSLVLINANQSYEQARKLRQ
jgi:hypothetical protein